MLFKVNSFEGEIKLNSKNEEYGWFAKFCSHSVYDYSEYWKAVIGCDSVGFWAFIDNSCVSYGFNLVMGWLLKRIGKLLLWWGWFFYSLLLWL